MSVRLTVTGELPNWHEVVKRRLGITDPEHDNHIQDLVEYGVNEFEAGTQRLLRAATVIERYPPAWESTVTHKLLRGLVDSVTSVTYYDSDNAEQTISSSNYSVTATDTPGRIYFHEPLPTAYEDRLDAYTITYAAGSSAVPILAKEAVVRFAVDAFEKRGLDIDDKHIQRAVRSLVVPL